MDRFEIYDRRYIFTTYVTYLNGRRFTRSFCRDIHDPEGKDVLTKMHKGRVINMSSEVILDWKVI